MPLSFLPNEVNCRGYCSFPQFCPSTLVFAAHVQKGRAPVIELYNCSDQRGHRFLDQLLDYTFKVTQLLQCNMIRQMAVTLGSVTTEELLLAHRVSGDALFLPW